eukprot:9787647-Alexandrium_andersonii.AAC.1
MSTPSGHGQLPLSAGGVGDLISCPLSVLRGLRQGPHSWSITVLLQRSWNGLRVPCCPRSEVPWCPVLVKALSG